jgi:hypothetical protein
LVSAIAALINVLKEVLTEVSSVALKNTVFIKMKTVLNMKGVKQHVMEELVIQKEEGCIK